MSLKLPPLPKGSYRIWAIRSTRRVNPNSINGYGATGYITPVPLPRGWTRTDGPLTQCVFTPDEPGPNVEWLRLSEVTIPSLNWYPADS